MSALGIEDEDVRDLPSLLLLTLGKWFPWPSSPLGPQALPMVSSALRPQLPLVLQDEQALGVLFCFVLMIHNFHPMHFVFRI